MSISFTLEEVEELRPQITVFGVGGAGSNAVNNMIQSGLTGVTFCVANTDSQALQMSQADARIQIGRTITQGLGAGARPEIGRAAAEESLPEIVEHLKGSHMCFIAAGMGGGTGTGAAPVIARAAKELDILTVGVVTKPFQFEGTHRLRLAAQGIEDLHEYVDTLIVIPNQNLFRIANERTTFSQAFQLADQVLHSGVRGVTDLMLLPGLINLDFADVRSVMSEMGKAMMGTGEAEGDHRAISAAEAAISNPLLDDVSLKGARAVLINITGGEDLTLFDVDEATNRIRNDVDAEANIIFGAVFNENMTGRVRVSVVATGIEGVRNLQNVHAHGNAQEEISVSNRTAGALGHTAPHLGAGNQGGGLWSRPAAAAHQQAPAPSGYAPSAPSSAPSAPKNRTADPLDDIVNTVAGSSRPTTNNQSSNGYAGAPSPSGGGNTGGLQQPPQPSSIRGLFGFMRSGKREEGREEMETVGATPAAPLATTTATPAPTPQQPVATAPAPAPQAAPQRPVAPVQQKKEEDQFEIPAFLRRQIN